MKWKSANPREYKTWTEMRARCNHPKNDKYKYYGERGISICDRWNSFANFLEDMGERPVGKTLDRIDNNGNYCKENCRWATHTEQSNNKSNNVLLTALGRTQTISQWSTEIGLDVRTLWARVVVYKWNHERCITVKKWGSMKGRTPWNKGQANQRAQGKIG